MFAVDLATLRDAFGIGVAGNFAGHLEQAGEARDFTNVTPATADAPKGVFPWYLPGDAGFLGTFPLSSGGLELPASTEPLDLQIEPEVGVLFTATYDARGVVTQLRPFAAGAFNDCSIRRPGAKKISEKKNWGPESKGLAGRLFPIADIEPGGALRTLRIASFLRRGGETHDYGIDSPAAEYSYAGSRLVDWIIERLANQTGAADTPLEPVGDQLRASGCPATIVVGIGATRYTPFGERNYLQSGDEAVVVVYDADVHTSEAVRAAVGAATEAGLPAASVLTQRVVGVEGGSPN